jgi:hypothetical protein
VTQTRFPRSIGSMREVKGDGFECEPDQARREIRRPLSKYRCGARRAIALIPFALLLNGCAVAVVGALGGAGALTYQYASTHDNGATGHSAATDPPTGSDPPPAAGVNPFDANEVYNHGISARAEAAERPGSNVRPNTAENSLASTVAGGVLLSPNYSPVNPFGTYGVRHPGGPTLDSLTSVTTFTVQAQTSNHNTVLRLPP